MQKFSDDTAIVACIKGGEEGEYRGLVQDFVEWTERNCLHLNITKTKEMVLDFRRAPTATPLQPIDIRGEVVEVVDSYKYLGVVLDNKLNWSANMNSVYKKGQSRMYFLRRLASFNVCPKLLFIFWQAVVSSALLYAVVCWGGSASGKDMKRLNRLTRKAGKVVGQSLESVESVVERRMLVELKKILENTSHPLHPVFSAQRSSFSNRLRSLPSSTERYRRSFVPTAIRLYNTAERGRVRRGP
ncbi:uncharacterized protein LOC112158182 [Oryzias melastigma]|uniref:uncharacterized protein LOC112158182 n=1 Tax=Oryzias melastigma TaxID=30732 RepID=UPI000CF7FA6A|nr:uncharacterized protein LOC112158182 [Oryzias melastigma]